ncbi:MAG: Dam family site-specific DNA-(adenine-N6)-methyltransferase, partial [bacterium]|nr:Dam family site-specific DNA-(adenine-N6)-methyltransferase [bacterium]
MFDNPVTSVLRKPFLKWAGGKQHLTSTIREFVPDTYNHYLEPFVGGGALFFDLAPQRAVLSDSNDELMTVFRVVRDDVERLIRSLSQFRNESTFYYRVRALNPSVMSPLEQAARFIYLNKTCYNGLYRVNKKGQFNTAFGRHKDPVICDERSLLNAHLSLQGIQILSGDYHGVLHVNAERDDFVF